MKKIKNVNKVECEKDKCDVKHGNVSEEVDVEGIMMKGESVVRGQDTSVEFDNGVCKKYDGVLVCKESGEW